TYEQAPAAPVGPPPPAVGTPCPRDRAPPLPAPRPSAPDWLVPGPVSAPGGLAQALSWGPVPPGGYHHPPVPA
ncbi:hypothetical protein KXX32_001000, partial [Aspergillus fumigatus]